MPISSSAHLIIVSHILNIPNEDLSIEVFLHFASLIAVVVFLRKRIKQILVGAYLYIIRKEQEYKKDYLIIIYLIISTLPIVLVTILFGKYIDIVTSNILLIGFLLIINGILLTSITYKKEKKEIKILDALVIGLFQIIGILPGISRSGSCLLGACSRKIKKEDAAEYAFLMFIPTSFGATVLKLKDISNILYSSDIWIYIIVFLITIITTYISLSLLLKSIKQGKIKIFSVYCIIIGLIAVLLNL